MASRGDPQASVFLLWQIEGDGREVSGRSLRDIYATHEAAEDVVRAIGNRSGPYTIEERRPRGTDG